MDLGILRTFSTIGIVAWALLMITLERFFPYDKGQKFFREGFFYDFVLYTLVQSFFLGIVISYVIEWIDASTGLSRLRLVGDWALSAQVLFFLITHDFYIYCFHRFQHNSKWFWRVHEAHHSNMQIDWLAGSRSHAFEILINQTIEFAPIILLGAAPQVAIFKGMIDAMWGMYIHSNINVRSGKLQYVINGPEMHRWHHAADEEAHNKNFGTKLALWDWIFGTAFLPTNRKPSGYGLGDPNYPLSTDQTPLVERIVDDTQAYIKQHAYSFRPFEHDQS